MTPRLKPRLAERAALVRRSSQVAVFKVDHSDGAMVAVRLPLWAATRVMADRQPQDGVSWEAPQALHVTLAYLGAAADLSAERVASLADNLEAVARSTAPFPARVCGYGRFRNDDDAEGAEDVIWAGFDAPALADLRHRVLEACRASGVEPAGDHGFTPHVTLGYAEPGAGEDAMPPDVALDVRAVSLVVGGEERAFALDGPSDAPLPASTFSVLMYPSDGAFSDIADLEEWAQRRGDLLVRPDFPLPTCVVAKRGDDVEVGVAGVEAGEPLELADLVSALRAVPHDFVAVGGLAARAAGGEWVRTEELWSVLAGDLVATPVFFASDLLALDGDASRESAVDRFEGLRTLMAGAGSHVVVPRAEVCRADEELEVAVDRALAWRPVSEGDPWLAPSGATCLRADSPYVHGASDDVACLVVGGDVAKVGWTDEAREAALEARRQNHRNRARAAYPEAADAVDAAGLRLEGYQEGAAGKEGLLLFTDPQTGSTYGLRPSDVTPDRLAAHVAARRGEFAKDWSFGAGPGAGTERPGDTGERKKPNFLEATVTALKDGMTSADLASGGAVAPAQGVFRPRRPRKAGYLELPVERAVAVALTVAAPEVVRHPKRKQADGDSFATSFGAHTFVVGRLEDGEYVDDPDHPRVSPYEALLARSAWVGHRRERRYPELPPEMGFNDSYLSKVGWTDEARAAALEARRRRAASVTVAGKMRASAQEAIDSFPKHLTNGLRVMRDQSGIAEHRGGAYYAHGEVRVAPEHFAGVLYSHDMDGERVASRDVADQYGDDVTVVDHAGAHKLRQTVQHEVGHHVYHTLVEPSDALRRRYDAVFGKPGAVKSSTAATYRSYYENPERQAMPMDRTRLRDEQFAEAVRLKAGNPKAYAKQSAAVREFVDALWSPVRKDGYEEALHPRGEGGRWREKPLSREDRELVVGLKRASDQGVSAVDDIASSTPSGAVDWDSLDEDAQREIGQAWVAQNAANEYDNLLRQRVRTASNQAMKLLQADDQSEAAKETMRANAAAALLDVYDGYREGYTGSQQPPELTLDDARRVVDGWRTPNSWLKLASEPDYTFGNRLTSEAATYLRYRVPDAALSRLIQETERAAGEALTDADREAMHDDALGRAQDRWAEYYDETRFDVYQNMLDDGRIKEPFAARSATMAEAFDRALVDESEGSAALLGNSAPRQVTEALRTLVAKRASQIMPELSEENARGLSDDLWVQWKKNSQSGGGLAMQRAATHALGARDRALEVDKADDKVLEYRSATARALGQPGEYGFAGRAIDAVVRAQYDVTQWALARAGLDDLVAYRGVMIRSADVASGLAAPERKAIDSAVEVMTRDPAGPRAVGGADVSAEKHRSYATWLALDTMARGRREARDDVRLPELGLKQAALQSFTFSRDVANNWDGISGLSPENSLRVVLRADLPRQAIYSLPAFGEGEHEEREVIAVGAPWRAWDAWLRHAPDEERWKVGADGPRFPNAPAG